jgi:hypothetical protein
MSKNNSYIVCKTGFDPEIVLSSVRTVIEEQNNSLPAVWQEHRFNQLNTRIKHD